jgi:hypothetical protein
MPLLGANIGHTSANMNNIERDTNEKIYLFIHAMYLHRLHGLPKAVIMGILGYLTQRELSGLAALTMQFERKGVLRVRLGVDVDMDQSYRVVRDDSVVKRAEGVRVGMVFTFALPQDIYALKKIQDIEEIIDDGWGQGVIREFVEDIAKVSQVRTRELKIEETIFRAFQQPSCARLTKPKMWKKFVLTKHLPKSQVSVGPRGLDNRPAWITRDIEHDFLLVPKYGWEAWKSAPPYTGSGYGSQFAPWRSERHYARW